MALWGCRREDELSTYQGRRQDGCKDRKFPNSSERSWDEVHGDIEETRQIRTQGEIHIIVQMFSVPYGTVASDFLVEPRTASDQICVLQTNK